MVGMMTPNVNLPQWQAYQQQMAAHHWQMQQHAAYMAYYNGMHPGATIPLSSSMYSGMQIAPPSLMPPGGLVPPAAQIPFMDNNDAADPLVSHQP